MADAPFLAAAVTEQAGRRMQEQTPAPKPQHCIVAIEAPQHSVDLSGVTIEILEPVLGCAPIVIAVPRPLLFDRDEVAELADETVTRHNSAGKKVPRDPVYAVAGVKAVRGAPVTENVDKENALRRHPGDNSAQQLAPVRHVLEHFD